MLLFSDESFGVVSRTSINRLELFEINKKSEKNVETKCPKDFSWKCILHKAIILLPIFKDKKQAYVKMNIVKLLANENKLTIDIAMESSSASQTNVNLFHTDRYFDFRMSGRGDDGR